MLLKLWLWQNIIKKTTVYNNKNWQQKNLTAVKFAIKLILKSVNVAPHRVTSGHRRTLQSDNNTATD